MQEVETRNLIKNIFECICEFDIVRKRHYSPIGATKSYREAQRAASQWATEPKVVQRYASDKTLCML